LKKFISCRSSRHHAEYMIRNRGSKSGDSHRWYTHSTADPQAGLGCRFSRRCLVLSARGGVVLLGYPVNAGDFPPQDSTSTTVTALASPLSHQVGSRPLLQRGSKFRESLGRSGSLLLLIALERACGIHGTLQLHSLAHLRSPWPSSLSMCCKYTLVCVLKVTTEWKTYRHGLYKGSNDTF